MALLVGCYLGMKSYRAIYGAHDGFFDLGAGSSPVVFGGAYGQTGSWHSVLVLAAVFLVLGAVAFLGLARYRLFDQSNAAQGAPARR